MNTLAVEHQPGIESLQELFEMAEGLGVHDIASLRLLGNAGWIVAYIVEESETR